jgi:hypothetical protein
MTLQSNNGKIAIGKVTKRRNQMKRIILAAIFAASVLGTQASSYAALDLLKKGSLATSAQVTKILGFAPQRKETAWTGDPGYGWQGSDFYVYAIERQGVIVDLLFYKENQEKNQLVALTSKDKAAVPEVAANLFFAKHISWIEKVSSDNGKQVVSTVGTHTLIQTDLPDGGLQFRTGEMLALETRLKLTETTACYPF